MQKRIALITGPTSGIGKATALELAKRGFNLILVARDPKKAGELQMEIGSQTETSFVECDLASLTSVQQAIQKIKDSHDHIDVLINNAGIMMDHEVLTTDGVEMTFAVNHLGHFLLTTELIDLLKAGKDARIVHVSSELHRSKTFRLDQLVQPDKFNVWTAYSYSKFANILFSNELARRLQPFGITSNAVHPGGVATSFGYNTSGLTRMMIWLAQPFFKSPEEGAQTGIYVAYSPEIDAVTGKYFKDLKPVEPHKETNSQFLATRLWELSETLVKNYKPSNA